MATFDAELGLIVLTVIDPDERHVLADRLGWIDSVAAFRLLDEDDPRTVVFAMRASDAYGAVGLTTRLVTLQRHSDEAVRSCASQLQRQRQRAEALAQRARPRLRRQVLWRQVRSRGTVPQPRGTMSRSALALLSLSVLTACDAETSKIEDEKSTSSDTLPSEPDTSLDSTPQTTITTSSETCTGTPETALLPTGSIDSFCSITRNAAPSTGVSVDLADVLMARIQGTGRLSLQSIQPLGDLDGDGREELAVGGAGEFLGFDVTASGEVWLFNGADIAGTIGRGDAATVMVSDATPLVAGDGAQLLAGDVRGVGSDDLIVSGSGTSVYAIPLPAPPGEHSFADLAALQWSASSYVDRFTAPALGDVTGDGVADLSFSGDGPDECYHGGVKVLEGPATASPPADWATFDAQMLDQPDLSGDRDYCSGAMAPAVIHDVNEDGTADVLMGGEELEDVGVGHPDVSRRQGGFLLFDGGMPGRRGAQDATAVLRGECGATFGRFLSSVGDLNGDCLPDLAAGGSGFAFTEDEAPRGAVYVLTELHRAESEVPLSSVATTVIYGDQRNDGLDTAGRLGDLDGDGFDDLLVSARYTEEGGTAYIFLGPLDGVRAASEADLIIHGEGGQFGTVVSSADIDGDGVRDVVISARSVELTPDGREGEVYVLSGADLLGMLP